MDKKINEALTRYGIPIALGPSAKEPEAATIQADIPINKDIDRMTLDELLLAFLGENRLASAREIPGDQVHVDKESKSLISGSVKEYSVVIDIAQQRIDHDCVDFRTNRAKGKLLCKHRGACNTRGRSPRWGGGDFALTRSPPPSKILRETSSFFASYGPTFNSLARSVRFHSSRGRSRALRMSGSSCHAGSGSSRRDRTPLRYPSTSRAAETSISDRGPATRASRSAL